MRMRRQLFAAVFVAIHGISAMPEELGKNNSKITIRLRTVLLGRFQEFLVKSSRNAG
ncbi:MAG TPA: hypothetical protein VN926_13855 [Bradyrhizobium sp.]|jgi:hypothetical protein|nr:hypothetical protein [Bradyrhizobium sp.]